MYVNQELKINNLTQLVRKKPSDPRQVQNLELYPSPLDHQAICKRFSVTKYSQKRELIVLTNQDKGLNLLKTILLIT